MRRRRTREETETLESQILEALASDRPQSVRHVFYRMTNPRLAEAVEKSDRGYRHVQYLVTKLRRDGRLPYGWITDATRRGHFVDTFQGGADFLRQMTALYRGDLWRQAEHYVEVWCESRSIAGVIQADCAELAVSLYPCGGFSSISFAHGAAEFINAAVDPDKPVVILYVGDYDPAGVLIDRSLEAELRRHLDSSRRLSLRRLAVTEAQIEEMELPTKPRKSTDCRSQHVRETVEAEAMPASTLRDLVREAVELYLPEGALEVVRVAEQSEREHLERWAELMERAGPGAVEEFIDRAR